MENKMTQKEQILIYLNGHPSITQRQANALGIYRLAARISDLRKDGHDISVKMIRVKNRGGSKSTVAAYSLGGE